MAATKPTKKTAPPPPAEPIEIRVTYSYKATAPPPGTPIENYEEDYEFIDDTGAAALEFKVKTKNHTFVRWHAHQPFVVIFSDATWKTRLKTRRGTAFLYWRNGDTAAILSGVEDPPVAGFEQVVELAILGKAKPKGTKVPQTTDTTFSYILIPQATAAAKGRLCALAASPVARATIVLED